MGQPEAGQQEHLSADMLGDTSGSMQPRFLFTVDGHQPAKVLPLVCDIVLEANAELIIGSPVNLPEQTPLRAPEPRREGERLAAQFILKAKQQCDRRSPIDQVVMTGHDRDSIVRTMIDKYDVSLFITEDQPRSGIRSIVGFESIDEAAVPASCNTVMVTRIGSLEAIDSILIPVARGPHSGFAIETGLALARRNEATLELLHVYSHNDDDGLSNGVQVLGTAADRLKGYEPAEQTLLESEAIPEAIIDHSHSFDITVFGAPREGKLRQFILGTIPEAVTKKTDGTVLIAHRGGADESWLDKWI